MKVVRLPRGGWCVFWPGGGRTVITRDPAGALWLDHDDGAGVRRAARTSAAPEAATAGPQPDDGVVRTPVTGRVARVLVGVGQDVVAGDPVVVVELMKTELRIGASRAGRVVAVHVADGAAVSRGAALLTVS